LPKPLTKKLSSYEGLFGAGALRSQLYLLAVAVSVYGIQVLLEGHAGFISTLIYTFIAGNAVSLLLSFASPLFADQIFPRNWIIYTALLLPVSFLASALGAVLDRVILRTPMRTLQDWSSTDIPFGALIVFVLGLADYLFISTREKLQAANAQLAQQVQHGRQQIESHASELQAAFDIQSSLLPRTVPQITGVEISCAWQPARTVSGDFFDVIVLSDTRIGFCLADVSGKGMSAALITANLQAIFRAFAPNEASPARLCQRLNDALCANLPAGRFVTLAYGILDRTQMKLTYELAGHNPPLLLRGSEAIPLTGTGPVLGLLPGAVFSDQTLQLQPGDRLLLSTDGVTEAFNPADEEFGEERMIDAARRSGTSAHAMRVGIMREVTVFAQDHFHDDASVMVVAVA
jgi:sigma-B regulation protein RsbU (phosphoserine phosphatase)